jgi:hypothetical protein
VAQGEAGRRVLGLAATNKAVEELRGVGLEAMTIARLRIQLADGRLASGTLLVVDEVSKVSTRDAAVVLDAAVVTRGAGVWFLGDPRQGTRWPPAGSRPRSPAWAPPVSSRRLS